MLSDFKNKEILLREFQGDVSLFQHIRDGKKKKKKKSQTFQ